MIVFLVKMSARSKVTKEYLAITELKNKLRELQCPVNSSNRDALVSQLKNKLKERECSISCEWHWQLATGKTQSESVPKQGSQSHTTQSKKSYLAGESAGYGDDYGIWTRNLRRYDE